MVVQMKFNANSRMLMCKSKINSKSSKKVRYLSIVSSKVQVGTELDYIISQMYLNSNDLLGIKLDKKDFEKNHGGYLYLHWERMCWLYFTLKRHKVKTPRSFYLPINPHDIINHPTGLYVPGMPIPDSIYFNYGTKKVFKNFWLKVNPFIFLSKDEFK